MIKKLFIVRKYVYAKDVSEVIRIEGKVKPHDIFVDDDWKKEHALKNLNNAGFGLKKKKK